MHPPDAAQSPTVAIRSLGQVLKAVIIELPQEAGVPSVSKKAGTDHLLKDLGDDNLEGSAVREPCDAMRKVVVVRQEEMNGLRKAHLCRLVRCNVVVGRRHLAKVTIGVIHHPTADEKCLDDNGLGGEGRRTLRRTALVWTGVRRRVRRRGRRSTGGSRTCTHDGGKVVSGETKCARREIVPSFEDSTEEPYQDDFVGRLPLCVATKLMELTIDVMDDPMVRYKRELEPGLRILACYDTTRIVGSHCLASCPVLLNIKVKCDR